MLHLARSRNTSLSRCLLAGVASGILASLLSAGYAYLFARGSGVAGGTLLSPLPFFYGIPLLFVVASFIFFEMIEHVRMGRMIYMVVFSALTVIAAIFALNRYEAPIQGHLLGIILITGLLLAFLLPYLATHAKIFMDKEEYSESTDV